MKTKSIIKLCMGIVVMLTVVSFAAYSYFSMIKVDTGYSLGNANGITFQMSASAPVSLNIDPYNPLNETYIAMSDNVNTTVFVQNDLSYDVTCSYYFRFQPDDGSDYLYYSPDNVIYDPEIGIVGHDNSNQNSDFEFILQGKSSDSFYIMGEGSITVPAHSSLNQLWTFNAVYHNFNYDQSINANKSIGGSISMSSRGCRAGSTLLKKVQTLVGSSNTDSNSQPWTVKNEDGLRYQGKNPSNFICFKKECTDDDLYRIVGIVDSYNAALTNQSLVGAARQLDKLLKVVKYTPYNQTYFGTSTYTLSSSQVIADGIMFLNHSSISDVVDMIHDTLAYSTFLDSLEKTPANYYISEKNVTGLSDDRVRSSIFPIYASDFLYASYETGSCSHADAYNSTYATNCANSNWLITGNKYWTLSRHAVSSTDKKIIAVDATGNFVDTAQYTTSGVYFYPSFVLNSNIVVTGTGTYDDPYRLVS